VEPGRDKISVFSDMIPPGVYEYNYLIRPVTPGVYLTPGPTVSEMYAPDNFGRGAGQSITVRPVK
jgi:uncharacterized protein YfaS (alpha-2-macroglobulin family)